MNKKGTRALASATVVGLVLSTAISTGNVQAAKGEVTRLGGSNRYETAAKVAKSNWDKAETVILVNGNALPDALSASLLADKLDAPILLTGKEELNKETSDLLKDLGSKNVYILGSTGVVSENVEKQLKASGKNVKRLAGDSRYETNIEIAKELIKKDGVSKEEVLVVNGTNRHLVDALTSGPVSANEGKILLLVGDDAESAQEAKDFIKENGIKKVTAIGNTATISDEVYKEVGATNRVSGGTNRFETNLKILEQYGLKGEKLYIANGEEGHLVDSLVASALKSPIVLVSTSDKAANEKAVDYIKNNANEKTDLNAVGSASIVSDDVVGKVNDAVKVEAPEVVAAEKAVKAYETASIGTAAEIEAAKALKAPAVKAVEAVKDAAQKEALNARIAAQDKAIAAAEAKLQLSVESVSAINASELVVNFNKELDTTTAENKDNYQLKVNDIDSSNKILNIKVDGKKATILLDSAAALVNNAYLQSGDKYVIQTNDAIKSVDGKRAEKFVSEEKTFNESAEPVLKSVKTTANGLELEFDRPVNSSSAATDVTLIKVDGVAITSKDLKPVAPKTADAEILGTAGNYNYKVTLTDPEIKAATEKGTHEVVIYDVKDTAKAYPKVASVVTGSYTITDEVMTPEVTGIEAVNANKFFLYTNTKVALDKAKVVVEKGNHEFAVSENISQNQITIPAAAKGIGANDTFVDAFAGTHKDKDGVWVVVTDDKDGNDENPLYKSGETTANLKVTLENYTANGLVGKKSVQNVTLNKNNTKPVIKETSIDKENTKLVVTFDNALANNAGVALTALTADDIVVRDKDNIVKTTTGATVSGAKVTINGLADVNDAPYTVEFKADKFKNLEDSTTVSGYLVNTLKNDKLVATLYSQDTNFKYSQFTFDIAGVEANLADVDAAGEYFVEKNQITFCYAVDMSDSARNVANYTLDGKALPAGSTVDFVGDKKMVRVTLPEGTLKASTQYKFGISTNVTTAAGSYIVGSLQTKAPAEVVIELKDNIKPELKSAQYLVAEEEVKPTTMTKKIEVTFNEKLADFIASQANAKNDFKVVVNGSTINVDAVADGTAGDEKVVLTLAQAVNVSQEATISIVPEVEQKGTADEKKLVIKDVAGNEASTEKSIKANTSKYNVAYAAEVAAEVAAEARVVAYEALALDTDANIKIAVDSKAAQKEGSTAAVTALANGATKDALTARIAAMDAKITAAATIATVEVADVNVSKAHNSVVQANVVAKNAAGVELNTAVTGVTYNWTVDSNVVQGTTATAVLATDAMLVLTNNTTKTVTATVTNDAAGVDAGDTWTIKVAVTHGGQTKNATAKVAAN